MKTNRDPFVHIFQALEDRQTPSDGQKGNMLKHILEQEKVEPGPMWKRAGQWVALYPWRFAFGAAAVQTATCTLLFGSRYINLLLQLFGG